MNSFRKSYYVFDQPVPYKKLLIHPVKIRDFYEFQFYATSIMLEKNSIKDPQMAIKAISMSYFEYLMAVANEENKLLYLFDGLLRLILNKKSEKEFPIYIGNNKDGKPFFKIENETYNSEDFDELKKIIAEQNLINLPNERIQKNVRDNLDEARRFKQKLLKNKIASFEEQIMALSLYTGWSLDYIYDLSYRKFAMAIRRANHMIMSNIYLTADMSGFVTFKDKSVLKTWLTDIEIEDEYGDVKMNPDDLKGKANFSSAEIKK